MVTDYQKVYGLIGFPLRHSFSQDFFNKKFEAENISARYFNFEIPSISEFPSIISANPLLAGLNVTIPYKEQVIPYLDELDQEAAKIGAVNVVKIKRDDNGVVVALKGFNSDIIGFTDSIVSLLKPWHRKALILGTGGAAKAVCQGLINLNIEPTFVSRNPKPGQLAYSDLSQEVMDEHKVIVNTTPLGMYPHIDDCPDIPYQFLTPEFLCYDLLYNPDVTLFMRKSSQQGAVTKNGLEMLLMQAFAAWNIWNSNRY